MFIIFKNFLKCFVVFEKKGSIWRTIFSYHPKDVIVWNLFFCLLSPVPPMIMNLSTEKFTYLASCTWRVRSACSAFPTTLGQPSDPDSQVTHVWRRTAQDVRSLADIIRATYPYLCFVTMTVCVFGPSVGLQGSHRVSTRPRAQTACLQLTGLLTKPSGRHLFL